MNKATPFHKILIANRGEIALRVIRSAHAMGYRVRTAEYAYTEWVKFDNATYTPDFTDKNKQVELYNHSGDVDGSEWTRFENANLAEVPENAALVAQLATILHRGPNLLHPAAGEAAALAAGDSGTIAVAGGADAP